MSEPKPPQTAYSGSEVVDAIERSFIDRPRDWIIGGYRIENESANILIAISTWPFITLAEVQSPKHVNLGFWQSRRLYKTVQKLAACQAMARLATT